VTPLFAVIARSHRFRVYPKSAIVYAQVRQA
jgi:hypothetical protein